MIPVLESNIKTPRLRASVRIEWFIRTIKAGPGLPFTVSMFCKDL
jgi:hypothetical protein